MDEKTNENNLPIKAEEKKLLSDYPQYGRLADNLKRIGKAVLGTTIGLGGYGISLVGGLPISLGLASVAIGTGLVAKNTLYKPEPSLLFFSKKRGDTINISQDVLNIGVSSQMIGYTNPEKASMMGLQTLVGFSRYKQNFKDMPYEIDENGRKIYSQKLATITHRINLDNLKNLETLGYIKIDSMEDDFPLETAEEKLFLSKTVPRRGFLTLAKIGFGNWKGAVDSIKANFSKDEESKEKNSEIMEKVTFRLTDKLIDFEEIMNFTDPQYRKNLPEEQRYAARKIGLMSRILKSKGLEIKKDSFGRDYIKYPSIMKKIEIKKEKEQERIENKQKQNAKEATDKLEEMKKQFDKQIEHNGEKQNFLEIRAKDNIQEKKTEQIENYR